MPRQRNMATFASTPPALSVLVPEKEQHSRSNDPWDDRNTSIVFVTSNVALHNLYGDLAASLPEFLRRNNSSGRPALRQLHASQHFSFCRNSCTPLIRTAAVAQKMGAPSGARRLCLGSKIAKVVIGRDGD